MACREIYTEANVAEMSARRLTLQALLEERLAHLRGVRGWKLPKFFALRKFEEIIRMLASPAYCDTGYQERSHKDIKPSARFTNNHPSQVAGQMVRHSVRSSAARRLLEASAGDKKERRSLVSVGSSMICAS